MRIHSESKISHPQPIVYAAYRDRLSEIAAYMDDIKEIVVIERTEGDEVVKIHNEWISERDIPRFARKFIKPEMLRWDDFAEWKDAEGKVYWQIKLRVFTDQVTCSGTNSFREDGAGTKVVLEGDLDIDLKNIPGVPKLLAGGIKPQLEKFIVSLITPNLEKVNQSLQVFLDDNASG